MLQPNLVKVLPLDHMRLMLYYQTGEIKQFDVTPYAEGSWYGELKDKSYFQMVRLLPGGTGIEWPHGQDIAPHELYDLGQGDGSFVPAVCPDERTASLKSPGPVLPDSFLDAETLLPS